MIKGTRQIETPWGIEPVGERDRRVVQTLSPNSCLGIKPVSTRLGESIIQEVEHELCWY
jgi:hypothetical protein